uniref:Protein kinase domain-containing protein n=1 Tax=Gouania willdenowi TaxID=441366 RepID=A0A8C5GSP1_GOUWI
LQTQTQTELLNTDPLFFLSTLTAAERPVLRSSTADYSILERIGEGGFGKVLKCQNLKNNKTVAVKIIKDAHITNGQCLF